MDTIRQIFPLSFQPKNNFGELIYNILQHVVADIMIAFALSLLLFFPVIRVLANFATSLVELYLAIGVIISILDYTKIIK